MVRDIVKKSKRLHCKCGNHSVWCSERKNKKRVSYIKYGHFVDEERLWEKLLMKEKSFRKRFKQKKEQITKIDMKNG